MPTPLAFFIFRRSRIIHARARAKPACQRQSPVQASIIRLNHAGWCSARLAAHFGRHPQSIYNDLGYFEKHGVSGLGDGKAPGAKSKFTYEIEAFMHRACFKTRLSIPLNALF